jgi:glycosyltransferase involved in cell wall biosynthesis
MMINVLTIFKIVWAKILFRLTGVYDYSPMCSVHYYSANTHKKRALLSYRVIQLRMWTRTTWSAGQDVRDMVRALSELGYVTDVVHSRDTTFQPTKEYDLFVGHEGYNFERIARQLSSNTPKILFTATAHWKFLNDVENMRLDEVFEKKGVRLNAEREILEGEDVAFELADGIIMSGNEACRNTYPPSEKIFLSETASLDNKKTIELSQKNFVDGKNNFLMLSGSGNAHKRLDVLLEVFSHMPDKHLYICTVLEDDFAKLYTKELFHTDNIHYVGYVKAYSTAFYQVMETCNFIIFPSCAEGSPGSVVDSMMQGLIPLVSRASHIDIDGLGYYIEPCTHEEIRRIVDSISTHDEEWYRSRSALIQKEARVRFSQDVFRKRFKQYIRDIVSKV